MSNKDTFADFGEDYQQKVVRLLFQDHMFAEQMADVLESKFFTTKYLQEVVKKLYEYRKKYSSYPSMEIMDSIVRVDESLTNTLRDQIREYLRQAVEKPLNGDARYVQDSSLTFCRRQTMGVALGEAIEAVENQDLDSVLSIVRNAMVKGASRDFGHEYLEGFDIRSQRAFRKPVSTGWDVLDKEFGGGFDRGTITTFVGGTGCHAKGQGILMYDGRIKAVENIVVGDRLMGGDGTPRTVLRLISGKDEMHRITPVKGDSWLVNVDHVLTLAKTGDNENRYGYKDGDLIDVTVKEWLGWSERKKHNFKLVRSGKVEFGSKNTQLPMKPYLLGLLLGDGSFCNSDVTISSADNEIVKYCEQAADSFGLRLESRGRYGYSFSGTSGKKNPIAQILERLELRGSRSGDKFVPISYKLAASQERAELLAGLIDTDGSLQGNVYDYITTSERLATDVLFIARSLGLAAYCLPCIKMCQTGATSECYRISISGNIDIIPARIARKIANKRQQKKNVLRTGFTIENTGVVQDYYGFTLDGDGRYLLDDFTITHNSGKSMALVNCAASAVMNGLNVVYITLELSDWRIGQRHDAYFSGIALNDLVGNQEEVRKLVSQNVKGKLFIKEFPTKKASVETIRSYLQRLQAAKNVKIDMLVVDYPDLLKSIRGFEQKRFELENNYEELRGLAQEFDLVCLVVDQTNRSGLDVEVVKLEHVSECYNKLMICDAVITIARTISDKQNGTGRIHIAKSRFGETGAVIPFLTNTGTVKIFLRDPNAGIESGETAVEDFKKKNENLMEMAAQSYEKFKNKKDK